MRTPNRMTLATAAAVLLTTACLQPLTEDRSYLPLTAALVGGSALIGILGRLAHLNEALIRILLLIPGGLLLFAIGISNLPGLLSDTRDYVFVSAAPMEPHVGFTMVSSFVMWLLYLVTEAITVGLERPGWAFPALVVPYLVPALVLPSESSPLRFALVAAGYVAILATSTFSTELERAGRSAPVGGLRRGVVLAAGGAALTTWLGVGLISSAIPDRGTSWIDTGSSPDSIQLGDPSQDLIRNIQSNSDQVVIRYSTSDEQGRYLRLTALSSFDATGFQLVPTELVPGPPPTPEVGGQLGQPVSIEVVVEDFGSEYLPIPWIPNSWQASGDWRYDPRTLSVVSIADDRKSATRFLEYTATVLDHNPSVTEIAAANAGDPGDEGLTLGLPAELSQEVRNLASEVTAGANTDGERVLALLEWLRSDEFTYTTATVAGSTLETVADFLLRSRSGYCEQFSGSMAILARVLGIPSRVAVGFLPGAATDDGFEVTVQQMHAWTEVYLAGLGWVAFDPTPSGASNAAPAPTPTATPTQPEPSVPSLAPPSNQPANSPPTATPTAAPAWQSILGWVCAGVVASAALALSPALTRTWRRWQRLRPGLDPVAAAEDAWDELRDTTRDIGLVWPAGTPRQVAAELSAVLDASSADALRTLALAVEQARFAPTAPAGTDPAAAAREIIAVLDRDLSTRMRRLFPRSTLPHRHAHR